MITFSFLVRESTYFLSLFYSLALSIALTQNMWTSILNSMQVPLCSIHRVELTKQRELHLGNNWTMLSEDWISAFLILDKKWRLAHVPVIVTFKPKFEFIKALNFFGLNSRIIQIYMIRKYHQAWQLKTTTSMHYLGWHF